MKENSGRDQEIREGQNECYILTEDCKIGFDRIKNYLNEIETVKWYNILKYFRLSEYVKSRSCHYESILFSIQVNKDSKNCLEPDTVINLRLRHLRDDIIRSELEIRTKILCL